MSLTQQYAVREVIIDRMLHSEQGATLKELMAACNDALIADGRKGVRSLNTISADITNISNRYNQEIEEIKESYDHRIIRYRYANRNFSIYNIIIILRCFLLCLSCICLSTLCISLLLLLCCFINFFS